MYFKIIYYFHSLPQIGLESYLVLGVDEFLGFDDKYIPWRCRCRGIGGTRSCNGGFRSLDDDAVGNEEESSDEGFGSVRVMRGKGFR